MSLANLRLRKNAERRLKAGHLWIYSNEINVEETPLKQFTAGEPVIVEAHNGKALGTAYVNPNTLICGRMISRSGHPLDRSLLVHRINIALSLREQHFSDPYYRLVYGDSDKLPGLIVDRFGNYLVVQTSTWGMENVKEDIISALIKVLKPSGILFKNEGSWRCMENLPNYNEVVHGEVPDKVELIENNTRFTAPVINGQKTGWFYDHRMARARLQKMIKPSMRVLDVFSYIGGWGVEMATAGAESVTCIDSSESALACIEENASMNGVGERVKTLRGDAFKAMSTLIAEGERYDVIIIDPPAFIKRRKDQRNGEQAYRRANELAMRLLKKEGLLVSCSCSMHLPKETLVDILRSTSLHLDRSLTIFDQCHQGPDHPIHPAIPETEYLKSIFCRLLPTR